MSFALKFALIVVLILVLYALILMLINTLRIGGSRWNEAKEVSGSFGTVLRGEVETDRDGLRDIRVAKGQVWDKTEKRWLRQGKLSDEYIKDLIS